MNVGILGSGLVAQTIANKLTHLECEVRLGTRDTGKLIAWREKAGAFASFGSFSDAATFGEIVFNCTAGRASLEALQMAGASNLDGKILIDVANPLDFSKGRPPTLTICNTDSLGEQIQRAFPNVRVVKALNTVNAGVMIRPNVLSGDHDLFICGNDPSAKAAVSGLLTQWFGWKTIIDLGDITAARSTEMMTAIDMRLIGTFKSAMFNYHIVRPPIQ